MIVRAGGDAGMFPGSSRAGPRVVPAAAFP